jgi:hypothetical protein
MATATTKVETPPMGILGRGFHRTAMADPAIHPGSATTHHVRNQLDQIKLNQVRDIELQHLEACQGPFGISIDRGKVTGRLVKFAKQFFDFQDFFV